MVILMVVPIYYPAIPPETQDKPDCMEWDWTRRCRLSRVTNWPSIGISLFTGVYSSIYTSHIVRVYFHLRLQLYRNTRATRVLWRIQVRHLSGRPRDSACKVCG